MAKKKIIALTKEDRDALAKGLEATAKKQASKPVGADKPVASNKAADVYLIRVPCGETIPAMVGKEPGFAQCCLFKSELKTDITSDEYVVLPILCPNGTTQRREIIYNIYNLAAGSDRYWRVQKAKDGRWLVERPSASSTGTTSTTSTTLSVEEQEQVEAEAEAAGVLAGCQGGCKWVWSTADGYWTLESDTCVNGGPPTVTTTTTTTTPDPYGTTTTTTSTTSTTAAPTAPCLCPTTTTTTTTTTTGDPATSTTTTTTTPDPATTTTTTTSTTTTTPEPLPCQCSYPTFCGTDDGECTFTYCSDVFARPAVTCTSTTTMDAVACDCATSTSSTTLPPPDPGPNCGEGCIWECTAGGWVKLEDNCASIGCPGCHAPGWGCDWGSLVCGPVKTDCGGWPPVPPPPTCSGTCEWVWDDLFQHRWLKRPSPHCTRNLGIVCVCPYPSWDGVHCSETTTLCGTPTTSTPAPCFQCYTSTPPPTTSTTSTVGPGDCDTGHCRWKWNGSSWDQVYSQCGNCGCAAPSKDGEFECEVMLTPCSVATTTTTTTTTSTTTTSTTTTTCDPAACSWFCGVIIPIDSDPWGVDWVNMADTCVPPQVCDRPPAELCSIYPTHAGNEVAGCCIDVTSTTTCDPNMCTWICSEFIDPCEGYTTANPGDPECSAPIMGGWVIVSKPCGFGDDCVAVSGPCSTANEGERQCTPCSSNTTTTTTTSTTTTSTTTSTTTAAPTTTTTAAPTTTTTAAPTTTTTAAPTTTTTAAPTTTTTADPYTGENCAALDLAALGAAHPFICVRKNSGTFPSESVTEITFWYVFSGGDHYWYGEENNYWYLRCVGTGQWELSGPGVVEESTGGTFPTLTFPSYYTLDNACT